MTNLARIRMGAGFFMLMLSFACKGPTVPLSRKVMTVARHNTEKFPTLHGEAENPKHNCNACHGGTDSFTQFNCLGCHAHQRDENDRWHAGVAGYKYDSGNCYACHPAGVGDGSHTKHFPIGEDTPHDDARCEDCHKENDYKSYTCVECHDHARSAMDKKHNGVTGYVYNSADCVRCHPDGEGFDMKLHETFFPIASGTHSGNECNACHTKGDYKSFSCIDCHDHAQPTMDAAHAGNPNYVYASANCLSCHPTGQAMTAAQHEAYFPIASGTHAGNQCVACHTTGDFKAVSCIDCHSHDQAPMSTAHAGVPSYVYATPNCLACHPKGVAFTAAQHASLFPITSGAHDGYQCKDCHSDGNNFSLYTCTGCHEGKHVCSTMNSKHSSVNGYQCVDTSCFACHPNGKH